MTIAEMHTAVKLGLDKTSALELPAFEPEEIDYWLNKHIRLFVKHRYSGSTAKGDSIEQTQARFDDIRILVREQPFTSFTTSTTYDKPNSYLVDIAILLEEPYDYLHTLEEEVTISYTDSYSGETITKRQGVTEIDSNSYRFYIDNPYSEHRLHYGEAKPLRLFKGAFAELVTDGTYSISGYYIKYLRAPQAVSLADGIDCELPEYTHDTIVDMTVATLLENIESPRYQVFKADTGIPE